MHLLSKYWGTKRIYTRGNDFKYTPSQRAATASVETTVTANYGYEISDLPNGKPGALGEGVIIYVIESEVCFDPNYLDIPKTRYSYLPNVEPDTFSHLAQNRKGWADIHGTLVANMAAGVQFGAAPQATLVAVYRDPSKAKGLKAALELIKTHYDAQTSKPPAIINMSFGQVQAANPEKLLGFNPLKEFLDCDELICELTDKRGILLVAAAGNEKVEVSSETRDAVDKYLLKSTNDKDKEAILALLQGKQVVLPASHPKVLSVGGHDEKDDCTQFYHGSGVDIYAPGFYVPYFTTPNNIRTLVDTVSPDSNNRKMSYIRGTSYATPLVVGSIARRMSERQQQGMSPQSPEWWIGLVKAEARVKIVSDKEKYLLHCCAPVDECFCT